MACMWRVWPVCRQQRSTAPRRFCKNWNAVVLPALAFLALRRKEMREAVTGTLAKLPLVRTVLLFRRSAVFCRNLSILLGNGGAGFTEATGSPHPVGAEPLAIASGDFNGDGALDLATADGGADTVSILTGTPSDAKAPQTTIDKAPHGKTDKSKAKIKYSANEPSTFECRLKGKGVDKDLRKFSACGSAKAKYKHLKPGKKKFQVRAVDAAGNVDESPATSKWKITG